MKQKNEEPKIPLNQNLQTKCIIIEENEDESYKFSRTCSPGNEQAATIDNEQDKEFVQDNQEIEIEKPLA